MTSPDPEPGDAREPAAASDGVVVADRQGTLVCWNRSAVRLLGPLSTALDVQDILGPRPPPGGAAADGPAVLPSGVAVRLLKHPAGELQVVVLMRVPRPSRPAITPVRVTPSLRIDLLGPPRVSTAEGRTLGGEWLRQRPGLLLKLLVAERSRALPAEEIAEALWPSPSGSSLVGVRQAVHLLRKRLEPAQDSSGSSVVIKRDGGYALDLDAVALDVDRFERGLHAGPDDEDPAQPPRITDRLESALRLYRGDFLADEPYADWALAERERLRALASDGLRSLVDILLRERRHADAAGVLERLATMEPYDVDVHRRLIALCVQRGRRSEAVRRYGTLRDRMQRAFGEPLTFTLSDVIDEATSGFPGRAS